MASAVARPRNFAFNEPITIAKYYMERLRHEEQEILIVMLLDGKNHFLGRADAFPGNREFNSDHSKGGFYGSIEFSRCKCDPGS